MVKHTFLCTLGVSSMVLYGTLLRSCGNSCQLSTRRLRLIVATPLIAPVVALPLLSRHHRLLSSRRAAPRDSDTSCFFRCGFYWPQFLFSQYKIHPGLKWPPVDDFKRNNQPKTGSDKWEARGKCNSIVLGALDIE